jgi:hypothetical protein
VELFGDQLAAVAQEEARRLDPARSGLHQSLILDAVLATRNTIRGNAATTLSTALNHAQHRFDRVGRGTWAWKETESTDGLSGLALLDEAYLVAKRLDPEQKGVHYEQIKAALLADGVRIGGANPGNTVFGVLSQDARWFKALGAGLFRWH